MVFIGLIEASAQRGLPGQIGIGLSCGTVDGFLMRDERMCYRYWIGVDAVRYNRGQSYWNFSAHYLQKDHVYDGALGKEVIPMAQFTAEAGYNLPLLRDKGRNITLFGGVNALAGYETIRWGDKMLDDGATLPNGDGFIYGFSFSASLEGYVSDRVILMLRVRQRCAFGSSKGVLRIQPGLGIRFLIN